MNESIVLKHVLNFKMQCQAMTAENKYLTAVQIVFIAHTIINIDHSFPQPIFPKSAAQFAKCHGSLWQIYPIHGVIFIE